MELCPFPFGKKLRLEQERIPQSFVDSKLSNSNTYYRIKVRIQRIAKGGTRFVKRYLSSSTMLTVNKLKHGHGRSAKFNDGKCFIVSGFHFILDNETPHTISVQLPRTRTLLCWCGQEKLS